MAVSSVNRCYYCLTAHGAAVRQLSGDPVLGEMMVMNYRAAELGPRHRAMLDFAVKLLSLPAIILTLGLFTWVINALMLQVTSWLAGPLGLDSWHVPADPADVRAGRDRTRVGDARDDRAAHREGPCLRGTRRFR